jgi:hypothetical protein
MGLLIQKNLEQLEIYVPLIMNTAASYTLKIIKVIII